MLRKRFPIFNGNSKSLMYLLGISYTRYSLSEKDYRNTWYGPSADVIEKVRCLLGEKTNKITLAQGSQYRLQIRSRELHSHMKQRGLGVPKKDRPFPGPDFLDDFVRGLYESNVTVTGKKPSAQFYYPSIPFKQGLYDALVEHAGISRGRTIGKGPLALYAGDLTRLRDFMYRDRKEIIRQGLSIRARRKQYF
jgi:hypothetical protein